METNTSQLTEDQLKRIEENRQRALAKLRAKKEQKELENKTISTANGGADKASHRKSNNASSSSSTGVVSSKPRSIAAEDTKNPEQEESNKKKIDRNIEKECSHCNDKNAYLDATLFEIFDERVCIDCTRSTKSGNGSPFDLITKGDAQKTYLLNSETIDVFDLPFKSQNNPLHGQWSKMKLYLRKHVHKAAMQRHGSEEKLAEEIKKRSERQYIREVQKTEDALSTSTNISMFGGSSKSSNTSNSGKSNDVKRDPAAAATVGAGGKSSSKSSSSSSSGLSSLLEKGNLPLPKNALSRKRKASLMGFVACIRGEDEKDD